MTNEQSFISITLLITVVNIYQILLQNCKQIGVWLFWCHPVTLYQVTKQHHIV